MKLNHIINNPAKAFACLAVAMMPVLSACDSDFDLSDVNTDITVGGDIKVPIGETEELTLSRIIDLTDQLYVDANGAYALTSSGSIDINVDEVEKINVKDLSTEPNIIDLKVWLEGSDIVPEYLIESDVETVMHMDADQEIPEEVERIDRLDIQPTDAYVIVKLLADNMDVISKINDACLKDFRVEFPPEVIFGEGIEGMDYTNNVFYTTQPYYFDEKGEIRVPFPINGLTNLPEIVNHSMSIVEDLDCTGHISAVAKEVCGDDFAGFKMTVEFEVPVFEVEEMRGIVNSEIDIKSEIVELGDLPDIVTDPETNINVNTISLTMSIDNPIGVPFKSDLLLTALDGNRQPINQQVSVRVPVAKADGYNQTKRTHLFITNSETLQAPAGYTKIFAPDLNKLIGQVPEFVQIDPAVEIDKSEQHLLVLGKPYKAVGEYDMQMPFDFGEGSHIVYRESIDDLNSDIEDFSDKVTSMEVFATVTSTLPFEVKISLTPIDLNGRDMSDRIDYTPYVVVAPGNDSAPAQDVEMKFSEKVKGAFADLDKIEITVDGNTKAAISVLKPTQYVKVQMTAHIPDGITITEDED